ncbi:MAG TPA: ATP-binding protein [Tepidisphaeraceae bacterium]|nr:ATP-binding protein [Bryobacteraceae bacterium]HWB54631.1 ATP-binding protein [Tepidisphaeraceae bacterium]
MANLTFSVDSALLSELGEKLVESAHIALVELIKNAYDADATRVSIVISPNAGQGTVIQIVDNGLGMTFRDVERYWMRVATTNKATNKASERYGRPRTGSKGIGRFSCRRLGNRLHMVTRAVADGERLEQTDVIIDWQKFVPGADISTINCDGQRRLVAGGKPGTSLRIEGGSQNEWSKRGYDFLKRQLAVLAANRGRKRVGFEEDPGFEIRLEAADFNEVIVNLRDRLLTAGWGDLRLRVSATGEATCVLNAMKIGEKTITHPERFPALASVSATIGIMPGERIEMRDQEVISKGTLKDILDEWGGVYVRYRGFRVYPYGEPGNDWLNIERDRATRKTALSQMLQPFAAKLRGVDDLLPIISTRHNLESSELRKRSFSNEEGKAQ